MKNIKLIISLLIFSIFINYSCTDSNNIQKDENIEANLDYRDGINGNSCLENPSSACDSGNYVWQIVLPQYPNCKFNISIDYYACLNGGGDLAIHLGDFELSSPEEDCQDYIDGLKKALINGTEAQFTVEFNQSVWREVTSNILNGYLHQSVVSVLEVEYNIGACKYLCYLDALDCGEACCRKRNIYHKVSNRWVLVSEGQIEHLGDCTQSHSFCDPTVLQSGMCFDNCESLDF